MLLCKTRIGLPLHELRFDQVQDPPQKVIRLIHRNSVRILLRHRLSLLRIAPLPEHVNLRIPPAAHHFLKFLEAPNLQNLSWRKPHSDNINHPLDEPHPYGSTPSLPTNPRAAMSMYRSGPQCSRPNPLGRSLRPLFYKSSPQAQ